MDILQNPKFVTWESDGGDHWQNNSWRHYPTTFYVLIYNNDGENIRIDCNSKKQAIELAKSIKEELVN